MRKELLKKLEKRRKKALIDLLDADTPYEHSKAQFKLAELDRFILEEKRNGA